MRMCTIRVYGGLFVTADRRYHSRVRDDPSLVALAVFRPDA